MFNDALASDYLKRAGHRLKALEVLMQEESWADVVREAQELVGHTGCAVAAGAENPALATVQE